MRLSTFGKKATPVQDFADTVAQALRGDFAALQAAVSSIAPDGSNAPAASAATSAALQQMTSDLAPFNDAGYMRQRGSVLSQIQAVKAQLGSQVFPLLSSIWAQLAQVEKLSAQLTGSYTTTVTGGPQQVSVGRFARFGVAPRGTPRRSLPAGTRQRYPPPPPPPPPSGRGSQQSQQLQTQLAQAKAQLARFQNALAAQLKALGPLLGALGGVLTASFLAGSSTTSVPPPAPTPQCAPGLTPKNGKCVDLQCAPNGYSGPDSNGNCGLPCLPGYVQSGQVCVKATTNTLDPRAIARAALVKLIVGDVSTAEAAITAGNAALKGGDVATAQAQLSTALAAIADANSNLASSGLSGYGGVFGQGYGRRFRGLRSFGAEISLATAKTQLVQAGTDAAKLQAAITAYVPPSAACACPDGTPCPGGSAANCAPTQQVSPLTTSNIPPGGGGGGGSATPCVCPDGVTPCPGGDPTQCPPCPAGYVQDPTSGQCVSTSTGAPAPAPSFGVDGNGITLFGLTIPWWGVGLGAAGVGGGYVLLHRKD